jgi:hypothetical protein
VSRLAAESLAALILEINVSELLAAAVHHDKATVQGGGKRRAVIYPIFIKPRAIPHRIYMP